MKNYRAELVGVFGDPVDGNPTGVTMEAAFEEKGLNYRYLTLKGSARPKAGTRHLPCPSGIGDR